METSNKTKSGCPTFLSSLLIYQSTTVKALGTYARLRGS